MINQKSDCPFSPIKTLKINQNPLDAPKNCPWHRKYQQGKIFKFDDIFPHSVCPWLYYAIYPYFLGLYYGARFSWNESGDCNVCCPAKRGVNVIVRKRDNDGTFDTRISADMMYVIFAEITDVIDTCPFGHTKGQRIPFPTCMVEHYMCPAALHNLFPLLSLHPPSCIDINAVRCPDWNDDIFFDISQNDNEEHS